MTKSLFVVLVCGVFFAHTTPYSIAFTYSINADDYSPGDILTGTFDDFEIYYKQGVLQYQAVYIQESTKANGLLGANVIAPIDRDTWGVSNVITLVFYAPASRVRFSVVQSNTVPNSASPVWMDAYRVDGTFLARRAINTSQTIVRTLDFLCYFPDDPYPIGYVEIYTEWRSFSLDKIRLDLAPSIHNPVCTAPPAMDFTGDCLVNLADLAIFLQDWLVCGWEPQEACWLNGY